VMQLALFATGDAGTPLPERSGAHVALGADLVGPKRLLKELLRRGLDQDAVVAAAALCVALDRDAHARRDPCVLSDIGEAA
jgi:hypothetical protein